MRVKSAPIAASVAFLASGLTVTIPSMLLPEPMLVANHCAVRIRSRPSVESAMQLASARASSWG
jgi:hypothetical protein